MIHVWSPSRGLRKLKEGVTIEDYRKHVPGAKVVKIPSQKTLERWSYDCEARAVDGCRVEVDGHCPHGCPSWLLVLGKI